MNISSRPTSIAPMQSVRQVAPLTRTPDPAPDAPATTATTAPPKEASKALSTSKLIASFNDRIDSISDDDLIENAEDVEDMDGFEDSGIGQGIKGASLEVDEPEAVDNKKRSKSEIALAVYESTAYESITGKNAISEGTHGVLGQSFDSGDMVKEVRSSVGEDGVKIDGELTQQAKDVLGAGKMVTSGAAAVFGVVNSSVDIGLNAHKLRKDSLIKDSRSVAEEASSLEDKANLHQEAATGLQRAANILADAESGDLPQLDLEDEDDIETIDTLHGQATALKDTATSMEDEADELEAEDDPDEERIGELRDHAQLCRAAATVLTDYAIGDHEALEDNDQGSDFEDLSVTFTSQSHDLERQATSKNLESQSLRESGISERWENGIGLGSSTLGLGSNVNGLVNFANQVHEATGHAAFLGDMKDFATGAVGNAAASGAFAIAAGGIEIATTSVDIHQSRKRRDAAKNMLEPNQKNLDKAVASLNKEADKLEAKAKSALEGGRFTKPNPEKAAKLEKAAAELRARAAEYAAKGPQELSSKDVEDIAKHIKSNQKLTFKFLKIAKAVLTVTAGVLAIVAIAAVAVTPVGWALAGVAAAAGIGLGIYKLCKSRANKKAVAQLEGQLTKVNEQLKDANPNSKGAKELRQIKAEIESALTMRSPKFAAVKLLTTMQEKDGDGDPTQAAQEATRLAVDVLGMNPEQLTSLKPKVAVEMIMKKMGTG
ncbi:MAG: hypothetical protein ACAI44_11915 [Candidatus Sericytochromatia bacterium]